MHIKDTCHQDVKKRGRTRGSGPLRPFSSQKYQIRFREMALRRHAKQSVFVCCFAYKKMGDHVNGARYTDKLVIQDRNENDTFAQTGNGGVHREN